MQAFERYLDEFVRCTEMDRKTILLRQLGRTFSKAHENYVITRIVHGVGRTDVQFVTQQMVTRPQGRAMTDLYLPQLRLHIEVDEAHHDRQGINDARRDSDVVDATGHRVIRVNADCDLDQLNFRSDEALRVIREQLSLLEREGDFKAWDPDDEFSPRPHQERGYVDVADNPVFPTHEQACTCFDTRAQIRKSWSPHCHEKDSIIWFPKLYENDKWDNSISDDGTVIRERSKESGIAFVNASLERRDQYRRIVFAHARDSLGRTLYRFKGVFEIDHGASVGTGSVIHVRTSTRASTYPSSSPGRLIP